MKGCHSEKKNAWKIEMLKSADICKKWNCYIKGKIAVEVFEYLLKQWYFCKSVIHKINEKEEKMLQN